MKEINKINNFSASFSHINNSTRKRGISINRLFRLLGKRSNYVFVFVSFLIIIVPIPIPPGLSTIIAIPALFITSQIVIGKDKVWIPKWLSEVRISKNVIRTIDKISRKYLNKIDSITQERLTIVVSPNLHKIYDILLLVFALFSAMPVPFLCMIPAFAGALLSIALIVKDGLLTIVGLVTGAVGIVFILLTIKTFVAIKDYLFF